MNAPITSYVALAESPERNLHGIGKELIAGIQSIYEDWNTGIQRPMPGEALRDATVLDMGTDFTRGIGVFVSDLKNAGGTLQILHSFHQQSHGNYRRHYFAYRGEVHDLDVDVVELDVDLLDPLLAPRIHVYNSSQLQLDAFVADEGLDLVPAHAGNVPNTHLVQTRHSMYIPTAILPLVMEKDLTPCKALIVLLPAIQQMGIVNVALH